MIVLYGVGLIYACFDSSDVFFKGLRCFVFIDVLVFRLLELVIVMSV